MEQFIFYIDRLIPEKLRRDDTLSKARFLVLFSLIAFFLTVLTHFFISIGRFNNTFIFFIGYFYSIGPFLLIWVLKDLLIAGNLFLLLVAVNLNLSLYEIGGILSPIVLWLALLPIIALLILGPKISIIWLCLLAVNLISIYATSNLESFQLLSPEVLLYNALSVLVIFAAIVFLFWDAQKKLVKKLKNQQLFLEESKLALETNNEKLIKKSNDLDLAHKALEAYNSKLSDQNTHLEQVKQALVTSNEALERYAHTLKLQVLQTQMNPHFIFNALEAIQDFVAGKDERAANRYLSNFSKLMRLFLESSKKKYITLEDELKLLSLYMELEQLRFEPPFDFEIDCPASLDWGAVEIPSMLLQPFVENAINHGLKYKTGKGHLKIHIRELEKQLVIKIIDNGVGIKKAKQIKQKATNSYKSRAMEITGERLKTIQSVDSVNVSIEVSDRLINGEIQGTIVKMICPFVERF